MPSKPLAAGSRSPSRIPGRAFPGAKDARPFERQAEVRTFTSEALAEPVEWTGKVNAELFVTSTARDTDFIVRVSDVYPDGRSMLLIDYVRRARYREGFDREVFIEPGKVYKVAFQVGWLSQVFNRGHRIRVTVASTGATAALIAADVRSMVDKMVSGGVSLRAGATWLLSAEAHSLLARLKIIDANGTTLCGRPIVTDCPSGVFLLLATDHLFYARGDDMKVTADSESMIELDDTPTGDAVTPTAASATMISLFQEDAIAVKAVLHLDWSLGGPTDSNGSFAAVRLTSASYA